MFSSEIIDTSGKMGLRSHHRASTVVQKQYLVCRLWFFLKQINIFSSNVE